MPSSWDPASATFLTASHNRRLRCRESLDHTIASEHTSVDGEVAANHESSHGSVLLSQPIRLVGLIGLVLPTIDQDQTGVAGMAASDFKHGIVPTTAVTESWYSVSTSQNGSMERRSRATRGVSATSFATLNPNVSSCELQPRRTVVWHAGILTSRGIMMPKETLDGMCAWHLV